MNMNPLLNKIKTTKNNKNFALNSDLKGYIVSDLAKFMDERK